ncbi:MAG: tetratricopeptide repeat protein, partial [Candidatus Cloacimonetes bacterium]|nr:tetratricopeptide repeat protein [Candidatus Cloacimonadota bacterium]
CGGDCDDSDATVNPGATEVCNGLDAIHSINLTHRDLKPENILIDKTGTVKISDFDMIRSKSKTDDKSFSGTPAYASPEHFSGGENIDLRSDLYSLGIIMYELFTGKLPFQADTITEFRKLHLHKHPVSPKKLNPEIPSFLEEIILKLLQKNKQDRYQNSLNTALDFKKVLVEIGSPADLEIQATGNYLLPPKFVDRKKPLTLLKQLFKEKQTFSTIIIKGERGIGKTKFWEKFQRIIDQSEITIFHTKCDADSFAYQPLNEIVSNIFEQIKDKTDKQKAKIFGEFGNDIIETISPQLKEHSWTKLLERKQSLDGEKAKIRLFSALTDFLKKFVKKPTILCFDDLHEADEIIFEWLRYAGRNVKDSKLRLICLSRIDEEGKNLAITSLEKENNVRSLTLSKILFADTSEMVSSMLGTKKLDEDFTGELERKTGGNPLFIREIIFNLYEKGELRKSGDKWNLSTKLLSETSDQVEDIILERLSNLPSTTLYILNLAAVIGKTFDLEILQIVSGLSEDLFLKDIITAKNSNLLENTKNTGIMQFIHDAVREVLLAHLEAEKKKELHQKIAETIENKYQEDTNPVIDELANHYFLAGNKKKAIQYCGIAGESAQKKYASENAILNYERVIEMARKSGKKVEEIDYSGKLGNVFQLLGKWDECYSIRKNNVILAERIEDKNRLGKAYTSYGQILYRKGKYLEAADHIKKAIPIFKESDNKMELARNYGSLGLVYDQIRTPDEALHYYNKQLSLARKHNLKENEAAALGNIGLINLQTGKPEIALKYLKKQLKISEEMGNLESIARVKGNIGVVYYNIDNYKESIEYKKQQIALSKQIGYKRTLAISIGNLANIYTDTGEFIKAESTFLESIKITGELGDLQNLSVITGNFGRHYYLQKDFKNAIIQYEKAIVIGKKLGIKHHFCKQLIELANIFLEMKRYEEAQKLNAEGLLIAEEVKYPGAVYWGKLNAVKIDFKTLKNIKEKINKGVKPLEKMLTETIYTEEKAMMNLELYLMYKELNLNEKADEHRRASIKIYKKLYQRNPIFLYARRLKKLGYEILKQSKTNYMN